MAAGVLLASRHSKGVFVCKSFLILIFACLCASAPVSVNAQAPNKNQAPNLNNQKSGINRTPQPETTGASAKAKLLFDEGMKQTEAGQHSQAAESFRQAVRLDPEFADAYSALGREYFRMKEWQKAIDSLRRATVLHAKERDAADAPKPNPSIAKREEPRSPANTTSPTRLEPKLQATNLNAGVNPRSSESLSSEQPNRLKEKTSPAKSNSTSSVSTPPRLTHSNPVVVKTVPAVSAPMTSSGDKKNSSTPANAVPRSSRDIKLPQATNLTSALLKMAPSAPMVQYRQTKPRVSIVVTAIPPPSPATPTEQTKQSNATAKATSTNADIKPPQAISTSVTGVKPLNSKSETTKEHEQADAAAKAVLTDANPAPTTISSVPTEKPAAVDSQTTAQINEGEVEGARVSMNATPPPIPIGNKAVTPTEVPAADAPATQIYRVGPNDVLDIHLSESHSALSTLFTVTPSGLLEHPMLPEPLLVAGSTPDEIGAKIQTELNKAGSTENSQVIVGVRDYASHSILVSGLVKDPGTRFLRREAIPLYVAVADAQPLPEAATVTVVRSEEKRIYEMDLAQAADMNFLVHPGDVITLNPTVTQFIYIGGEVKFPGEKTFRRGLTLTQAVIAAGGASPKSKTAEVGRVDGQGFLVGTRFDLQEIQSGKAADPTLRPGDRVMILR